ncbi:MAG: phosphopyruvate hydratase [Candidatus Moranbacteria bacterium RIFCSPLOWO2_02_FULL_48_19]|nr:MAG: phosphopyruvate hydratase [Candidatus Moranbacteria bacterium RIFCSPLOWO2_02_FULL_48_19]OGI31454.1 MAG: phosphopyruvate hydratase [Candidatus Moranbacteria bacterium RIFCSPLOWO2_12_FULL_48_12]
MAKIVRVHGREILDSRGNPTVEVEVTLEDGTIARAGVPSGASTGAFEAVELRDNDPHRYSGLGVENAVTHVNGEIAETVLGMDVEDQKNIDKKMIILDGTENKARLGANAILGISLAVCRAAAKSAGIPLYEYIGKLYGKRKKINLSADVFPVPMFNILNGGKHSDSGLSVQEFKIIPAGIAGFKDQLRAGSEIFHALKKLLEQEQFSTGVGDEGGFAPRLESHKQALEMIIKAIGEAGYRPGEQVYVGLDIAANSFYDAAEDQYVLKPEGVSLSRESLINVYREWVQKYFVVSIEDGLHEEDWRGWALMQEKLGKEGTAWKKPLLFIGDDLLVTNVKRLEKAIESKSCNAVLIKVNQIGTVTETLECMKLAEKKGMNRMVSHRSGETVDDFIADLAVGTRAEFIKSGSLSRGERITKYNRLLEIWEKTRGR